MFRLVNISAFDPISWFVVGKVIVSCGARGLELYGSEGVESLLGAWMGEKLVAEDEDNPRKKRDRMTIPFYSLLCWFIKEDMTHDICIQYRQIYIQILYIQLNHVIVLKISDVAKLPLSAWSQELRYNKWRVSYLPLVHRWYGKYTTNWPADIYI